jgi:HlyD family secretion protein
MWSTGGRSVRVSRHRAQQQEGQGRIFGRWQNPVALRAARGVVAILLVASGVVACTTTTAPPRPNTAPVQRTSITSGVSATGSLTAITEQNLGFTTGGQLTAVNVKVGDRVTAGQVLATIDPFSAQQALDQARGQLRTQQANLDRLNNSPLVSGSQDTLDQAQKILQKTKAQADAQNDAAETAVDNARRALSQAKKQLDKAEDAARAACSSVSAMSVTSSGSSLTTSTKAPAMPMVPTTGSSSAACTSAQSAVTSAKSGVVTAQNNLDAAKQQQDVTEESGRLAVANAQQGVVSAQNALDQASSDRPSNISAQAGQVTAAQAAVDTAQRGLDDTTLRAPVDGTVSAVNGTVGEFVAASTGTSALAPGTDATLPGTNGAGSGAAAAQAVANPTRPGGTQFIVLDNVDEFQVVMAYTETDAAGIAPGQKVRLTFDAVPDLELTGSVLSVSPTATAISGVISYYVTVVLPQGDPRLKSGMTAQAEVLTKEVPGVLAVPSAAVRTQNGTSVVTVLDPNGTQRTVTVQTGATGDGKTQILSGVTEGQQVVLPATL